MKEKKQFNIPKNYDKKFEFIRGISGWSQLVFIPVACMDYIILAHTPFEFAHKFSAVLIASAGPYFLMAMRPLRENVPMWKHLYWKFRFASSQKKFSYRKEGYVNELKIVQPEFNIRTKTESIEGTGKVKKISSRLNSDKGHRKGVLDNSRLENGSNSKSVSS